MKNVARMEWIKLRSVRTTWWLAIMAVVSMAAAGAGVGLGYRSHTPVATAAQILDNSLGGAILAQLLLGALGVLVMTGEYGTGMIRSTFAAVPKRLPAIAAKGLVFAVTTFVVALVGLVITALATAPLLPAKGITPDFGDGKVWLALIGGAGYVALIGLLAFGIGLIIRSSAAGIAAALGLVLVAPTILQILVAVTRAAWPANIAAFLPSSAGGKLYAYQGAAAESLAPSRPGGAGSAVAEAATLDLGFPQGFKLGLDALGILHRSLQQFFGRARCRQGLLLQIAES